MESLIELVARLQTRPKEAMVVSVFTTHEANINEGIQYVFSKRSCAPLVSMLLFNPKIGKSDQNLYGLRICN